MRAKWASSVYRCGQSSCFLSLFLSAKWIRSEVSKTSLLFSRGGLMLKLRPFLSISYSSSFLSLCDDRLDTVSLCVNVNALFFVRLFSFFRLVNNVLLICFRTFLCTALLKIYQWSELRMFLRSSVFFDKSLSNFRCFLHLLVIALLRKRLRILQLGILIVHIR